MNIAAAIVIACAAGTLLVGFVIGYARGFESCNRIYRETAARERLKLSAHNHATRW